MQSIWLNLLWKECHEQKWKLAVLTVIVLVLPLWVTWDAPDELPIAVFATLLAYCFAAPVYIAAGVAAGEADRGTLAFLQATPVPRAQWATAKTVVGLATVLLPAAVLLAYALVVDMILRAFGIELYRTLTGPEVYRLGEWYALMAYSVLVIGVSVYLWSAAAGVGANSEIWAITRALLAVGGFWLAVVALLRWFVPYLQTPSPGWHLLYCLGPGGLFVVATDARQTWPSPVYLIVALVPHAALLAWFVLRFGNSTVSAVYSPKTVTGRKERIETFAVPKSSPHRSILWTQTSEILPLAMASTALNVLPSLLVACAGQRSRMYVSFLDSLSEYLAFGTMFVGFFFTVLIGVGIFLRDLEPGLNHFWRSRPIDAHQWFWTKYVSGLLLIVASLGVPGAILGGVMLYDRWHFLNDVTVSIEILNMASFALFLSATYAMSVALTALLRHTVYACLISTGGMLASFVILDSLEYQQQPFALPFAVVMFVLVAAGTLVAWLAVTRDWGWKH